MTVYFDEDKQEKQLSDLRTREEEELAQILAERYSLQYIDLSGISINTDTLRTLPEDRARASNMAIFGRQGSRLLVAILSPNQEKTQNEIKELDSKGASYTLYMVSKKSLERAWDRYKDLSFSTETKSGSLDISNDEISKILEKIKTIEDVKALVKEIMGMKKSFRISRIVEIILAGAIATKASDVHVEPESDYIRLRYRLDGVLTDIILFDQETFLLLLSRIKLLSGLKLNIKNAAQDGRFSIVIEKKEIEVRTSTLPGAYSESIVMRLLDPDSLQISLESLGITPSLIDIFKREIAKPNGMILNTGPTGSGKTTTLYAFLSRTKSPEIKIITIEDPIEYHLEGIVQTQVDNKKGYSFETGLRASLRQDPDVIMVGEIRDKATADTAIHASLTGHLVYSTLHTNNAAGAFPRLIDLGINPKIISSAITTVIAQRLVRKLCPDCKKPVAVTPSQKILLERLLAEAKRINPATNTVMPEQIHESVGCASCNGLGFKGRIAVMEAILNSQAIEQTIVNNPSEHEIKKAAIAQGIYELRHDGILKVIQGVTTLDELKRVVDVDEVLPE